MESPKNEGERLPVEGTSDLSDGLGARRKGEVTSAEETLIAKIEKILSGIDKTEIEDQEKGWWGTSTGAAFGAEKLAEIKAAIRGHFESGLTIKLTGAAFSGPRKRRGITMNSEEKMPVEAASESSAGLGAMTIDEHIAQAKEWGSKLPYYPGMTGWRTTCRALAEEVERLRDALDKLARLGNEPRYGNSVGNRIAQDALGVEVGVDA